MEQLLDDVASSSDLKFCGKTFGWVIYSRRFKRHQINAKPIFLASTLIYMIINVMPIIILQKETKLFLSYNVFDGIIFYSQRVVVNQL